MVDLSYGIPYSIENRNSQVLLSSWLYVLVLFIIIPSEKMTLNGQISLCDKVA